MSGPLSDAERVALATRPPFGRRWYGPVETTECERHPGHHESWRWTWRVGETIEHGATELVCGCSECDRECDADGTP